MKVTFCEQIFNSFGKIEQTKKNETGPIVITDTSEVSKIYIMTVGKNGVPLTVGKILL